MSTGQNDQTMEYVYGVTPTLNSDIYSNDLLADVRYPDKTTGTASSLNGDMDRYAYNALGDYIKLTDRNQTTREFGYDVAGRWLTDAATVLGAGVDGAVRRIETAFDTAGRPYLFTTHSVASGSSVVNQVQRSYNGLGQVTREYENHDGAVNTSTTPWVGYGYDTTALSGVLTKGSRATTLTYPNGRVVTKNYASGLDDTISRLSSLTDGATTLESYSYLGLGTVVVRAHPQPGVDLTYVTPGGTGDAGDQYTGLDRFARIAVQRWAKGATDVDRFEHTYDRNSNRLTRDVTAMGAPTTLDEAYTYDNLDRLTKTNRGTLVSGTITDAAATYARNWNLDPLGNWSSLGTDSDGGGAGSPASESRTHNAQNQVTAVGASALSFDSNGSLTSDATTGKSYTYDAWNALVKVTSGGVTIASHEYDALRRQAQSGTTTPTDERWFSLNWQVLETRPSDGKTTQQVWSPVYVDAMVARDRDTDANGSLDERVYAVHDANFDVTGTVDTSGSAIDRFLYDRYGAFTVLDANWAADADGVSDVAWSFYFQGLRFDALGGGYDARNRYYLPTLGRPAQADPLGYPDGMSRYEWEQSGPTTRRDPNGLCVDECSDIRCPVIVAITETFEALPNPTEPPSEEDLIGQIVDKAFDIAEDLGVSVPKVVDVGLTVLEGYLAAIDAITDVKIAVHIYYRTCEPTWSVKCCARKLGAHKKESFECELTGDNKLLDLGGNFSLISGDDLEGNLKKLGTTLAKCREKALKEFLLQKGQQDPRFRGCPNL